MFLFLTTGQHKAKVERQLPQPNTVRGMILAKSKYTKNDEGRFTCPHCEHTTKGSSGMFYHLKKHAGILDYPCTEPGCTKAFIQKSGLQQHMAQAHSSKDAANPYTQTHACPHEGCDHSCSMKPNLLIHIARKHSPWIPPYTGTCTKCENTFKSATAYYYHASTCFDYGQILTEEPHQGQGAS